MGQLLAARSAVRPSQLFVSVEGGVQPTASEAAIWCKLFVRIAGTFAGAGTALSSCLNYFFLQYAHILQCGCIGPGLPLTFYSRAFVRPWC